MASREGVGAGPVFREAASPSGGSPRSGSVEDVTTIAMRCLVESGRYRPATGQWRGSDLRKFSRFVGAEFGITMAADLRGEHVVAFMYARSRGGSPPSDGKRRVRLFAVRAMVHEAVRLGLIGHDPTLGIEPPKRAELRTRALVDEEIARGRAHSIASPRDRRRSVAWALSEATARTAEIGLVRAKDVDIERSRVWLPGTSTVDARWGRLTPWALTQVERRLAGISTSDDRLMVWRTEPRTLRAASSQAVGDSLRAAGLLAPDIRPRSITAWVGVKATEQGACIDEVARRLGMRSLDQAAELVGLHWRGGQV